MEGRQSESEIKCYLQWKLCRTHGWGSPVPKEALVDLALDSVEQGRGKELIEDLIQEPYIEYQEGKGYQIKNSPDAQAKLAFHLEETCGYDRIQIEATLSRFKQAGGFDEYDRDEVFDSADED